MDAGAVVAGSGEIGVLRIEFMKEQTRNTIVCLSLMISVVGCDNKSPNPNTSTTPSTSTSQGTGGFTVTDAEPIAPGPRPASINGACYFKPFDLNVSVDLLDIDTKLDRPWVVVEGVVSKSSDRLGVRCVILNYKDPRFGDHPHNWIDCEGGRLSGHRGEPGQNVVIRGQLYGARSLTNCSFVTQAEMYKALNAERAAE